MSKAARRSLSHAKWTERLADHIELIRCHCNFARVFGAVSAHYWQSTSYAVNPGNSWSVNFGGGFEAGDGHVDIGGKGLSGYVHAVRSGP